MAFYLDEAGLETVWAKVKGVAVKQYCRCSGANYLNNGFIVDSEVANTVTVPAGVTAVWCGIASPKHCSTSKSAVYKNGTEVVSVWHTTGNGSWYAKDFYADIIAVEEGDVFTAGNGYNHFMLVAL